MKRRDSAMRLLRGECPRCGQTRIFHSLWRMNPRCAQCGIVFERETGFFMMSIYVAYAIYFLALFPPLVVLVLRGVPLLNAFLLLSGVALLLLPVVYRYARIIWISVDELLDPRDK